MSTWGQTVHEDTVCGQDTTTVVDKIIWQIQSGTLMRWSRRPGVQVSDNESKTNRKGKQKKQSDILGYYLSYGSDPGNKKPCCYGTLKQTDHNFLSKVNLHTYGKLASCQRNRNGFRHTSHQYRYNTETKCGRSRPRQGTATYWG